MKIFEIFLNPKIKEGVILKTFSYEPTNIYEKRKGSLYMAGELNNVLPHNIRLLDNLAQIIRAGFYGFKKSSSEKSLEEALRKANEFLEKLAKDGNVDWIPHLNFVILNLKGFDLNFTEVGGFKILISREEKITDISKDLCLESFESYPLKVFGNIVSGELASGDRIIISSGEILDFLEEQKLVEKIIEPSVLSIKDLKKILKRRTEEFLEFSGICALLILTPDKQKFGERLILEKREGYFERIQKFIKKVPFPKVSVPKISIPKISIPKISLPSPKIKISLPTPGILARLNFSSKLASLGQIFKKPDFKKPLISLKKSTKEFFNFIRPNAILVTALIFLITGGFVIFQYEQECQLKKLQESLSGIEEKFHQAQAFLVLGDGKKANPLLKEAWEEIKPLEETYPSLKDEISPLQTLIKEKLLKLNKLKEIKEPKIVFEFDKTEFVPQKMIIQKDDFYFFSPYSQNLFKVKGNQTDVLSTGLKFNEAILVQDSILFFSKPNETINLKNGEWNLASVLASLSPDFSFNLLASFKENLYFLSKKTGEIAKYSPVSDKEWGEPQSWLKVKVSQLFFDAKSMTIDGSIWILKDNSLYQYFTGRLNKTIVPNIFPAPQNFSKILTSSSLDYLYILEPNQNRIVVLNKAGSIIQQFQSSKFDNLKDFAVSEDGKTIYLLNGQKLYELSLD